MEHEAKARTFLEAFHEHRPKDFFMKLEENSRGYFLIMRMLCRAESEVVAGDISAELGMSTPRVAAALRVLEERGQLVRTQSHVDARKVVVTPTEKGRAEYLRDERGLVELIDYVISELGEEKWDRFTALSDEVRNALEKRGCHINEP